MCGGAILSQKFAETKQPRRSAPYSSKIIKAGALIGDTKTLLSHWDVGDTADENIKRVQWENVFGKASRSRVEDILAIFRNRYLTESSVIARLPQKVRRTLPDLFPASQLPEVAAGVQFCQREDLTCPPR